MKDIVIALVLAVVTVLNLLDVITDIGLGVPHWHIIEESIIVLLSAATCCYLVYEMRLRTGSAVSPRTCSTVTRSWPG